MEDMNAEMREQEREQDMDRVKADLAQLRDDFKALLNTLKEQGVEAANMARIRARSKADEVAARMGSAYGTARARGAEKTESVQQAIEERPLTAVLIAFAVGLLAGKILAKGE